MSEFTIFDLQTRRAVRCVTCPESKVAERVEAGQVAIPGRFRAMRLNDNNEPEPDTDLASALRREARKAARMAQIEELERKMLRRVREVLAAQDPQLKALDDQIVQLRADLSRSDVE